MKYSYRKGVCRPMPPRRSARRAAREEKRQLQAAILKQLWPGLLDLFSGPPSPSKPTNVGRKPSGVLSRDKANLRRAERHERNRKRLYEENGLDPDLYRDPRPPSPGERRRFKTNPMPSGVARTAAPDDATGTIFPSMVKEWKPGDNVLVDAANNAKIGGRVLVGRLKGAHIVTLALEERATCPRSCVMWAPCMGNNLPFTVRWKDTPAFREHLPREIDALCAQHEKVLIRLHIVGDFIDFDYVAIWYNALRRNDNLNVFGFTAHRPDSDMGRNIAALRDHWGLRFAIRNSGTEGRWGSTTIKEIVPRAGRIDRGSSRATICVEQMHATYGGDFASHCGACGLCWKSQNEIVFSEH